MNLIFWWRRRRFVCRRQLRPLTLLDRAVVV